MLSQNKFQNLFQQNREVWKELKNEKNEYNLSLGVRRQKPIGTLNLARI
jgi:hypothetical protein